MSEKTTGTALVQVTLEVELSQPWVGEETLERVRERATLEARSAVLTAIQDRPRITIASIAVPRVLIR